VIGRWMPVTKRARAWGTVWMTSQVGAALSPLLVVPIQVRYGWRAPFFVFGLLGIAWSLAWYEWPAESLIGPGFPIEPALANDGWTPTG
jgi:MFS transporter, ACS family, glucarate transporter